MTDITLTDEEMVDWANASLDRNREMKARIAELEAENERLRKLLDRVYETANAHSLDCMWCAETADEIVQHSLAEKDDESIKK